MNGRSVVRAGRAFDGERAWPAGVAVFVEDGRIAGVDPAAALAPAAWEVHNFPAATVLPGLIDTHVHLCGDGGPTALASATSTAARHARLADRKGRLRRGCDADRLIVDGDPLSDITALERVRAVMAGGRWAEVTGPAAIRAGSDR